jgi:hypothetical protein
MKNASVEFKSKFCIAGKMQLLHKITELQKLSMLTSGTSSNISDTFKRYLVRVKAREPVILPEVSLVFSLTPGECYSSTFQHSMITFSLLFPLHHTPHLFKLLQLMQ